MGSWSVYCGISKIAITAGDKCVLLPLRKNKYQSYFYYTHQPATLPIFGEYNDYGGLENIERNNNTKLIEDYFGVSIDDFVGWFTEEVTYKRGEVNSDNFNNFNEMKDWNFMFINREVYDYLSNNSPEKGHLDFGNPKILELIGFTKEGKTTDNRFRDKYILGDKEIWSDGNWAQTPDRQGVYYFNNPDWGGLSTYADIPEDKLWIGEKSMYQLWEYLDDKKVKEMFLPILTGSHYSDAYDMVEALKDLLPADKYDEYLKGMDIKPRNLLDIYKKSIREFGNEFCELITLSSNLHPMSATFEPYIMYLTPQCGAFKRHQILLDKFAEINKAKLQKYDD